MSMSRCAILVLGQWAFCAVLHAQSQEPVDWQLLDAMPLGVFNAAAGRSGSLAVITGGITQTGHTTDLIQVMDLHQSTWRRPLHLTQGVCDHAQITLPDGRVLVAGGQTGSMPGRYTAVNACQLIDLTAGVITPTPPLPRPVVDPTAHLLPDGRAVVVGGANASVFDPRTGSWVSHTPLRESREAHASVVLPDGRVLVIGGLNRRSLELIDPQRGFSRMMSAKLPGPLDDLRAARMPDGRVWVLGGQNSRTGNTTDQTWFVDVSDPNTTRIEPGPRLGIPDGVADHCLVTVGPWVITAGGESEQSGHDRELTEARLLDTRSGRVWGLRPLSVPHDDAVAVMIDRGVILFGGYHIKQVEMPRIIRGSAQDSTRRIIGQRRLDLTVPVADTTVERFRFPSP